MPMKRFKPEQIVMLLRQIEWRSQTGKPLETSEYLGASRRIQKPSCFHDKGAKRHTKHLSVR